MKTIDEILIKVLKEAANINGHKLIIYDKPKGDQVGEYDGIPIVKTAAIKALLDDRYF